MTKQKKHPYKLLLRGSNKTSAIKRHYAVCAGYLLLAYLLTGCDFSESEPPHVVDKPDVENTRTKAPETPAKPKPLDLTISPEMIEALQHHEEEALTQTETPPTIFTNPSKEKDVNFSGKLHMDEDKDKEYLDSVEGAEVNINVKFE